MGSAYTASVGKQGSKKKVCDQWENRDYGGEALQQVITGYYELQNSEGEALNRGALKSLGPVSYTHLDVYKRQEQTSISLYN